MSRGQAWAIYGLTGAFESTSDIRFLEAASRTGDWFVSHLPQDKVPYWDFDAPGIPNESRDSAAAAIAASALIRLSQLPVTSTRSATYLDTAKGILMSLSSTVYLSEGTSNAAILLHGTAHKPAGLSDTGLVQGDYYFIEALVRYRALRGGAAAA